jgi:hypothetical protein
MRVPFPLLTMLLSPFLTWFLMLVPAVVVALVMSPKAARFLFF